jgi:hypothetical protein
MLPYSSQISSVAFSRNIIGDLSTCVRKNLKTIVLF